MNLEIICIGDELLIGQVINTNASWLGEQFSSAGVHIRRMTTVGDDLEDILTAFDEAWKKNDIVLCTGGLGPTHDDRTREAVLSFFHTRLTTDSEVLEDIESVLKDRGLILSGRNRDQANVPVGARIIRNHNGTAPGYHFSEGGRHFFVLPGVPYEMQAMTEQYILPVLASDNRDHRFVRTILTTGIPEAALADLLTGIDTLLPSTAVAFLPSLFGVRIRLMAVAVDEQQALTSVSELEQYVYERAQEWIYGTGNEKLEEKLAALLTGRSLTVSVAESCTGGLITDRITNTPGSSTWFERGVVVYSNRSKTEMLGIDAQLIEQYGVVSEQVCIAMAEGVRRLAGSDFGLSTTGIVGPGGGSAEKPVGLVWIGVSTGEGSYAYPFRFGNDRLRGKQRAAQTALDMLRRHLLQLPNISSFY